MLVASLRVNKCNTLALALCSGDGLGISMLVNDLFEPLTAHAEVEGALAGRIRVAVVQLLDGRRASASICPSEAARLVARDLHCEWRDLMRPVRYVAQRMVESGELEILQSGRRVEIDQARGPIRLRLRQPRLP
jgi:hypothetical protein